MKGIYRILGVILLFQQIAFCATVGLPSPVPPPDDDGPLGFKKDDLDFITDAMQHLIEYKGAEDLFSTGAIITSASTRSCRTENLKTWAIDFVYFLGQTPQVDYGRFTIIRIKCTKSVDTGIIRWHTDQSQELVLKKEPTEKPEYCLAETEEVLKACQAVLTDNAVAALTRNLFPYYKLQTISTPVRGSGYYQQPIPVTLLFVNRANKADRYTIQVDYSESDGAYSINKGDDNQQSKGGK